MILVTGTGQSGTSAFLELLDALGFDKKGHIEYLKDSIVQKIIEDGGTPEWPEVLKHLGGFCYNLNYHIDKWNWQVDHIFIVLRDLEETVRKRASRPEKYLTKKFLGIPAEHYSKLDLEEKINLSRCQMRDQIGALIYNILVRDYNFSLIEYPKFVFDREYCFNKIKVVSNKSFSEFNKAFDKAINLSIVNKY